MQLSAGLPSPEPVRDIHCPRAGPSSGYPTICPSVAFMVCCPRGRSVFARSDNNCAILHHSCLGTTSESPVGTTHCPFREKGSTFPSHNCWVRRPSVTEVNC